MLGRDGCAEETELGHALHDRSGVLVGVLELDGDGQHLLLHEPAHRGDDLVGDVRIGALVAGAGLGHGGRA